ncbi:hypothetical protein [Vandammella animalimorsus]|uniref:hypothetical protein n=1 Tax=Vandammella animalimorsus TaxID=2029117 RepID=UPI0011C46EE5|nr:hypothetical protein [Vandammella animalimorsus]
MDHLLQQPMKFIESKKFVEFSLPEKKLKTLLTSLAVSASVGIIFILIFGLVFTLIPISIIPGISYFIYKSIKINPGEDIGNMSHW